MDVEMREWIMGKWKAVHENAGLLDDARQMAEALVSKAEVAVFVNIAPNGIPLAKAMYPAFKSGINRIWFNTDASSNRLEQLKKDSLATVYCYDKEKIEGVMLVGNAFEEKERVWRERLWKKEFEEGYSGGIDDPDYQVLRFDARWCNCFYQGKSVTFPVNTDKDSASGGLIAGVGKDVSK
jgi:general stress protein 26